MNEVQALIRALEEQRNAALNGLAQAQARIKCLEAKLATQASSEAAQAPAKPGTDDAEYIWR